MERKSRQAGRIDPADLLEQALSKRESRQSLADTNARRLFNADADGTPGFVLEQFGDVLIAQLHEGKLTLDEAAARDLCHAAMRRLGARAVYRKAFARDRSKSLANLDAAHRDPTPWIGAPASEEFDVYENGMRFLVRPYDGYSVGLFLENRDNRARLRKRASGKRVLNVFAYTCGFSVATALGGAEQTVSVDVSGKYLDWGRRNFALNGVEIDKQVFIKSDAFDYFKRAKRQRRQFDLIVLDPPAFGRAKRPKRVFSIASDLERLAAEAVELLNPGGSIFLATNHRGTPRKRLERALHDAGGKRACKIASRPRLPADFSGDADYAKCVTAEYL